MTIQNIEDVMDRIMSLNRNLTEESLKTLLSASGWDREDILEGLRIFRTTTDKKSISISPISSQFVDPNKVEEEAAVAVDIQNVPKTDNPYSFNLKKKEDLSPAKEETVISSASASTPNPQEKEVEKFMNGNTGEKKEEPLNPTTKDTAVVIPLTGEKETKLQVIEKKEVVKSKKKGRGGIIVLLLILLLLLGLAGAYLALPAFAGWVNERLPIGPKSERVLQDVGRAPTGDVSIQNPNLTQPLPPVMQQNPNIATPTAPIINPTPVADSQFQNLMQEIDNLKRELANYKDQIPESTTIVKYVSQRGMTGPTGRGIMSVSATTTGFLITYTDNSNEIVPYSTTTILNILNAEQVCFRDLNATTSSSTDACLTKTQALKLLNN